MLPCQSACCWGSCINCVMVSVSMVLTDVGTPTAFPRATTAPLSQLISLLRLPWCRSMCRLGILSQRAPLTWRRKIPRRRLLGAERMRGATHKIAHLVDAHLVGAFYTTDTVWPDGFDPVKAGAILYLGLSLQEGKKAGMCGLRNSARR